MEKLVKRRGKWRNMKELKLGNQALLWVKLRICTSATLRAVKEWLNADMDKGLEGGIGRSTVPMLPSFVPELPTGEEEGTFLAMDLGGTNLRVMIMKISPDQEMRSEQFNTRIPDFAMHGTAEQLFDFIAKCLIDFLIEHGLQNKNLPLGFTFSYPCKQTSLRSARLLRWTKGFETRGVVNEDVVQLLEEAIRRDGRAKVDVVALINDTVGTMVAAAYENKTSKMCHIGVIIATGTNASYMERSSKVKFGLAQATEPYPFEGMVVDTEWGGFGDRDEALALKIMTPYDIHVDNSSEHPGVNTFDKLVAGKCMGEVCRLVLERLVPGSFPTKYISEILGWSSDETKFVLDELEIDRKYMGTTDILLLQEVCRIVSSRSAKLAAAAIACLSERINEKTIYVGIDGSTYKLLPFFEHHVVENIKKLVDPSIKVIAIQTKDGSGKGAALIAAIVSRIKNNREKVLKRVTSSEDGENNKNNLADGNSVKSAQKSSALLRYQSVFKKWMYINEIYYLS
uniref:Phosphotransferase n=1 Tax=Syphacia muris TaxID=451379 RepID=A0A158R4P1_9BILA